MSKISLLIIDAQNDFCDKNGALYVPGAVEDMGRLSDFINNTDKIDEIIVTLDIHKEYHISHPIFWVDANKQHPKPYTIIKLSDMEEGRYTSTNPLHKDIAYKYLQNLEVNAKYLLTVWPPHCITGSWGCGLFPPIGSVVGEFDKKSLGAVEYFYKSSNPYTEHYSAVKAEIPDPNDKLTMANQHIISKLAKSDKILIAGEALSHCVANTVMDLSAAFGNDLSKFILLKDASSSVQGFEEFGDLFLKKAVDNCMVISDTLNADKLL